MKMAKRGRKPDPNKSNMARITALIPKEEHLKFKAKCAMEDTSMNDVLAELVHLFVEGKGKKVVVRKAK
jgi:hypothetical protein